MSSFKENLDPASWDGQTYFKYLAESQKLQLSSESVTRNVISTRPDRVRLGALNVALKKYETTAFLRQTQPTD